MAKVIITIDDKGTEDEPGIRINIDSDPDFSDNENDHTIAQSWALGIVEMIMDNATEIRRVVNEDSDKH